MNFRVVLALTIYNVYANTHIENHLDGDDDDDVDDVNENSAKYLR